MICRHCGKDNRRNHKERSALSKAGIEQARRAGKTIGRPLKFDVSKVEDALMYKQNGWTTSRIAKHFKVSRRTVQVGIQKYINGLR